MTDAELEKDSHIFGTRSRILSGLEYGVLPYTRLSTATYEALDEEKAELTLSLRGKHDDTPSLELIEIASIAINMLVQRPEDELDAAFDEWKERHERAD